jgi:hypothetical protein
MKYQRYKSSFSLVGFSCASSSPNRCSRRSAAYHGEGYGRGAGLLVTGLLCRILGHILICELKCVIVTLEHSI